MKHALSDSDLWELVMQAGEAQAKLADLQLKLIALTRPPSPSVEDLLRDVTPIEPPPAVAPKAKDVPF